MGQTLHYYGSILSPSERTVPRGVVSVAEGHQTGLFTCTTAVHIGRQRPCYLHDETVLMELPIRISDGGDLRGNIATPRRGRHNVLHPGL